MNKFIKKIIEIYESLCSDDEYYKTLNTYKRNNSCPKCDSAGVIDRCIPAHTTTRLPICYEVHTFTRDLMLRWCNHCHNTWHEIIGDNVD